MPQIIVCTRDMERVHRATMDPVPGATSAAKRSESHATSGKVGFESSINSDNDVEVIVMSIWEELLGVPVDLEDNFFELGGHSLNGVQVLSRIRERFGVNLPLRSLFELVTPAQLAEHIRLMQWALQPVQDIETTEQREEIGI
jgi:acyl carrier protein